MCGAERLPHKRASHASGAQGSIAPIRPQCHGGDSAELALRSMPMHKRCGGIGRSVALLVDAEATWLEGGAGRQLMASQP